MGAACRSLRYELLMFLFAFEVNDAQDTCTCKCSYGDSGIQEKRRLIAGLYRRSYRRRLRFFRKLRHVYGLTFILCIWNAFSWRTGLCLLPLSILQFLCRGTSGNQDTKRNARQPGASSKADSGTSNFRSDLATGHPLQTGSISLGGR